MIEALWAVDFSTGPTRRGAGVLIFESGRAFGGDSQYYYIGDYVMNGDQISGELTVTHHAGPMNSVFGPHKAFRLKFSGATVQRDGFTARGHLVGNPSLQGAFHLKRLAELP